MDWPLVFFATVAVLMVVSVGGLEMRRRRNIPLDDWVHRQPVVYSTSVYVRQHHPARWVDWNQHLGGGPELIVRKGAVEVSAPQGTLLESRDICLRAQKVVMWIDEVGLRNSPIDRKKCTRLCGEDETGRVDLALSPDTSIDEAWQALIRAGVRPRPGRLEGQVA